MKTLFVFLAMILSLKGTSQHVKVIKYDCPDSLGYVTNQGGPTRAVTFFLEPDDNPTFYYVENFSPKDFHRLIYQNDTKVISRVKLVQLGYVAKPYHFLYAYNSKNALIFYYILKDQREEKLLVP